MAGGLAPIYADRHLNVAQFGDDIVLPAPSLHAHKDAAAIHDSARPKVGNHESAALTAGRKAPAITWARITARGVRSRGLPASGPGHGPSQARDRRVACVPGDGHEEGRGCLRRCSAAGASV